MAKKKKKRKDPLEEFDFFDIDKTRLDEEWVNQPKLFFKYAAELALAQKKESEARAARETIKAELSKKIRKDPGKFGLDKATEAALTNVMMTLTEFKEAQAKLLRLRYRVGLIQAAVNALHHRKSALERLVMLHGQNYFSTPITERILPTDPLQEVIDDALKFNARDRTMKKKKVKKRRRKTK